MEPSITLSHVKRITGISRNQLSEVFGYSPAVVARWEANPTTIPEDARPTFDELLDDFLAASDALDEANLTWDDMFPARIIAMKLGVSYATFTALMHRNRRTLWDFGIMGDWGTQEDLDACQQPLDVAPRS